MKKRGFTLIELLAVIVILAIIALIATPIILNMINNARKSAAVDSAYGYIEAVEYNNSMNMINKDKYPLIEDGEDIDISTITNINIKGTKPDSGKISISKKRVVSASLCISGYTVEYDSKKAEAIGKCNEEKKEDTSNIPQNGLKNSWVLNEKVDLNVTGTPIYNNNYVTLNNNSMLSTKEKYNFESQFTVALKFRNLAYSSNSDYDFIYGTGVAGSNVGEKTVGVMLIKSQKKIVVQAGTGDSAALEITGENYEKLFSENWQQIFVRYDGTKLSLWIDKEKVGERTTSVSNKDTELCIGGISNSGSYSAGISWGYMNGDYSNFAVYDRALSDDEIIKFKF